MTRFGTIAALAMLMTSVASEIGCGAGGAALASKDAGGGGGPSIDTTFEGGPTCASGELYDGGYNWRMTPGEACNACHAANEGPVANFAGTIFVEGHAEDGCIPSQAEVAELRQAKVVITGADGKTITPSLVYDDAFADGNFTTYLSVAMPYTAKVVYAGKERAMSTPQTNGDCNACHTVAGANGAPGRIALPR